nr:hypothetical protein [Tanacetum cinerariifolium]
MLGRDPRCRLLLEIMLRKREECRGSSSSSTAVGESALKVDDALYVQLYDDPPSVTASKAEEFIPGISIVAPKRFLLWGAFTVGSSYGTVDDLCSSEACAKRLASRGSSNTVTSLSFASTHSEPLEHAELVKGKFKRRLAHRDVALKERDVEIDHLRKPMNEKPF